MNDELDKALEWARGITLETDIDETRDNLSVILSAVRSLRETVKAKDEEIARLKSQLDDIGKWHAGNPSLDAALNEGDGSYKP